MTYFRPWDRVHAIICWTQFPRRAVRDVLRLCMRYGPLYVFILLHFARCVYIPYIDPVHKPFWMRPYDSAPTPGCGPAHPPVSLSLSAPTGSKYLFSSPYMHLLEISYTYYLLACPGQHLSFPHDRVFCVVSNPPPPSSHRSPPRPPAPVLQRRPRDCRHPR